MKLKTSDLEMDYFAIKNIVMIIKHESGLQVKMAGTLTVNFLIIMVVERCRRMYFWVGNIFHLEVIGHLFSKVRENVCDCFKI